jgi:hypothetical protein
MGNSLSSGETTTITRTTNTADRRTNNHHFHGSTTRSSNNQPNNSENSRVLFLLYLIHRTWNVVVDSVDQKGKRYGLITFVFFLTA